MINMSINLMLFIYAFASKKLITLKVCMGSGEFQYLKPFKIIQGWVYFKIF